MFLMTRMAINWFVLRFVSFVLLSGIKKIFLKSSMLLYLLASTLSLVHFNIGSLKTHLYLPGAITSTSASQTTLSFGRKSVGQTS